MGLKSSYFVSFSAEFIIPYNLLRIRCPYLTILELDRLAFENAFRSAPILGFFSTNFTNRVFPMPESQETVSHPESECIANMFSNTCRLLAGASITFLTFKTAPDLNIYSEFEGVVCIH